MCVCDRCTCYLLHVVLCTFRSCFCCFATVVKSFVYLTTHVFTPTGWHTGHVSVAYRSSPTYTPHLHHWSINTYICVWHTDIYKPVWCLLLSAVRCFAGCLHACRRCQHLPRGVNIWLLLFTFQFANWFVDLMLFLLLLLPNCFCSLIQFCKSWLASSKYFFVNMVAQD